ncbi:WD40/YVTN/BNR-like repeat-containing protein [Candidatus Uabimicrobium sp. HlEnr_7]|uniref:WD40/YVTN/BNR-like repeat-containing protein n=1 Tax=Candidatus Uabimicrobium helgolandensis TaxID=3095367 RepID=UPI003555CDF1
MKMILMLLLLAFSIVGAQEHFEWMLDFDGKNFYEIQDLSENYLQKTRSTEPGKKTKSTGTKVPGYKQFQRWAWFMEDRVYPNGDLFNTIAKSWYEYHSYLKSSSTRTNLFSGSWAAIGPSSYKLGMSGYNGGLGRVNCIAFDRKNPQILYIGTPSAGLWKRNSEGKWSCLTDELPTTGISGIALGDNSIFVLTGDGDGGNTNSIGVLKSADRGNTWTNTGLMWGTKQNMRGYKLGQHPQNNKLLIAVTSSGLFRTEDKGENWQQVAKGNFRDLEFQPGSSQIVYAATTNKIYRSEDAGVTWSEVTSSFPNGSNRIAIAVSPANNKTVYALFAGSRGFLGLYRSTDSGKTFNKRSSTPNLLGYSEVGNDSSSQSWYDLALAVSPQDANVVHIGGVNTWRSNDGGKNWNITSYWIESNSNYGYTHADIHALEYNGNDLYCGSDGGIYHSTDRGENWQDLSTGLQIMQIYKIADTPQDPYLLYAGAQDNGSNRITGSEGTHVFGADGGTCAIDHSNSQRVYIATQSGGMHKSVDGGSSFRSVKPSGAGSGAWVTPYVIHPKNAQTLFTGYTDVWKTTNGADSWKNISRGQIGNGTARAIAICQQNPDYIYVSKTTKIYRSSNGGNSWINISADLPTSLAQITSVAIKNNDPKHICVTFSGYKGDCKIYESKDAGNTWKNISSGLPNLPVHTSVYEPGNKNGIYIGTDVGIYYHNDTLQKWIPFSNGLPKIIVKDLRIHSEARKLRAGTFGRGLWESDLYIDTPIMRSEEKQVMTSYQGNIEKLK